MDCGAGLFGVGAVMTAIQTVQRSARFMVGMPLAAPPTEVEPLKENLARLEEEVEELRREVARLDGIVEALKAQRDA